jgi:hypothetical protein
MSARGLQRPSGVVVETVRPELTRLLRSDYRMTAGSSMLAGVLILRVIAAPDGSTGDTEPQMNPAITHFDAGRTAAFGHRADGHFQ